LHAQHKTLILILAVPLWNNKASFLLNVAFKLTVSCDSQKFIDCLSKLIANCDLI